MANDKCRNTNNGEWAHCNVCEGRIHESDCTSRKRKGVDCPQNHTPQELEAAGYGPAHEHEECLPTCTEKHAGGNYYVSVVDGTRVGLLAGPFALHRIALEWVEKAKAKAEEVNSRAFWYAYGTVSMKDGYCKPGILNDLLGIK
jgi:hypothetical protein